MTFRWNESMLPAIRAAAGRGVVGWMALVEKRAVDLIMNPPKTGRIYRRRGVEHQASAPNEAPANWTGRLVNSRRVDYLEAGLRARLMFSTAYAAYLELGTKNMEQRPFARRALIDTEAAGQALFNAEIKAVTL